MLIADTRRRSPWLQPYLSTAMWNRPLGTGATYVLDTNVTDPAVNWGITGGGKFIGLVQPSWPKVVVEWNENPPVPSGLPITTRVPYPGFMLDNVGDDHVVFVYPPWVELNGQRGWFDMEFFQWRYFDDTNRYVARGCYNSLELETLMNDPAGVDIRTAQLQKGESRHPHTGTGIAGEQNGSTGAIGFTAANTGQFMGVVRLHEMISPARAINHVMRMSASHTFMNPIGDTFVYPARAGDGTTGQNTGTLPYGSMLAIEPSVDIEALALEDSNRQLARALQRYGIVIMDRSSSSGSGNCAISTDPQAAPLISANIAEFETVIVPLLRVVTNVGDLIAQPNATGGGNPIARRAESFTPQPGA